MQNVVYSMDWRKKTHHRNHKFEKMIGLSQYMCTSIQIYVPYIYLVNMHVYVLVTDGNRTPQHSPNCILKIRYTDNCSIL